jgi:hypothetical protein
VRISESFIATILFTVPRTLPPEYGEMSVTVSSTLTISSIAITLCKNAEDPNVFVFCMLVIPTAFNPSGNVGDSPGVFAT